MHKGFGYKKNKYIILLIFGYLMSIQAAIIMIWGSIWDDSILTYLFAILFFFLFLDTYKQKIDKYNILVALLLDLLLLTTFILGIWSDNIQEEASVFKDFFKCLVVAVGGFFLCYVILNVWIYRIKNNLRYLQKAIVFFFIGGVVFSFHVQGIVELSSGFGYLFSIVLAECIFLLKQNGELKNHIIKFAGLGFAFMNTMGNMDRISAITQQDQFSIKLILCMIIVMTAWYYIWKNVLELCMKGLKYIESNLYRKPELPNPVSKKVIVFFFIFVCWMPYFLTYYPGLLSHDSIVQIGQAVGVEMPSNHHPWIHTMLIKGCCLLGMRLGNSLEYGAAIYSLLSMAVLSMVYTYIWNWMFQKGVSRGYRIATLLFYSLFPINAVYSITMWKDIFFSAIVLIYVLILYEACRSEQPQISTKFMVWFVIISFLVCSFRSNGLFIWIFSIFFLFYTFRSEWKKLTIMFIGVMSLFLLYKGCLQIVQIQDADIIESLSIPAQQVAYTIIEDGNISEREYEMLEQIIDVEKIDEVYLPYISDPIKNLVRLEGRQQYLEENKLQYLKLYISLGVKNPYEFTQAYINQTRGYWFHKINQWIYYEEGMYENDLGIEGKSFLPDQLTRIVQALPNLSEQLYHRYFSLALQTYLLIVCVVFAAIKNKRIAPYMPLAGVLLSLLVATPVNGEFRYVYSLFIAMPMIPVMTTFLEQKQ